MTVEFSRLIPVDRVPDLGSREKLEANEEERAGLAARFDPLTGSVSVVSGAK